jgi:glycosyltransferase involved in cell wall biosynthesis
MIACHNCKAMSKHRLAVIGTHPIQYYAPVFRRLAEFETIDLRVFYTWSQTASGAVVDPGFQAPVKWDVPLLTGYASEFVPNAAKRPGTHHFWGLQNPTLIRQIEAWQPDALLIYGWNSHSNLQALRHFKSRLPVLFRGDSTLLNHRSWWRKFLRRRFLTWIYRHVDMAIAVGSNNRDYYRWCGLPPERIAFAPHSIDTGRFSAEPELQEKRAEDWRTSLGIGPGAVVVAYAGKLQPVKNPSLLLDAFGALDGGSHLVIFGNGVLEAGLKVRAGTRSNVHFLPFQNQSVMPLVYRVGDVFALPSRSETWGLALNEAMACGRAVIASSHVGGARDLIRAGVNGWLFESGDLHGLVEVLRQAVARGREGLKAMGASGQALISHWSTEESARCIGDVVAACCDPGASRAQRVCAG